MKAVKENKVYQIEEHQKKFYQDAGFDITDETGKTIAYGRGKTAPYEDYAKLQKENAILRAENGELRAAFAKHEEEKDISEEPPQETKTTKKAGNKKAGE